MNTALTLIRYIRTTEHILSSTCMRLTRNSMHILQKELVTVAEKLASLMQIRIRDRKIRIWDPV
jgi:hypothetical protein